MNEGMFQMVINIQLRGFLNELKGPNFEKNIPYMYVDTTGNVTVGIGHNLTSHGDYQTLDFMVKRLTRKAVIGGDMGIPITIPMTIGRAATEAEKKNDYEFLMKHTGLGKFAAEQLADYTTLELKSESIDQIFEKDLQDAISIVQAAFGFVDKYPISCQAALIDIAFNCGGFTKFPTLTKAVNGLGIYAGEPWSERWKAAASHSNRFQVDQARNKRIAQWFMHGATEITPTS